MLSSNRLELVILLIPLPSLLAMGWFDAVPLYQSIASAPILPLLILSLAFFSLAYGAVRRKPILDRRTSRAGGLVLLGSVALFVYGSYVGSFGIHWAGLVFTYFGFAVFIGGRGHLVPVGLSVLPVASLASPSLFGTLGVLLEGLALACLSFFIFGLWLPRKRVLDKCDRCSIYERAGEEFCAFCGRASSNLAPRLGRPKIWKAALVTIVLVSLSVVSISVIGVSNSGISYDQAGFAGIQSSQPLPQGQTLSVQSSSYASGAGEVSVYSYAVEGKGAPVGVWVVASTSPLTAASFSSTLPGLHAIDTRVTALNQTITVFTWTSANRSYTGFSNGTAPWVLVNGTVATMYLTAFVGEQNSTFAVSQGSSALSAYQLVFSRLTEAQGYSSVLPYFLTVPAVNYPYIEYGAIASLFIVLFAAVRSKEEETLKMIENMWGLSRNETSLLSSLALVGNPKVGSELYEKAGERNGMTNWDTFHAVLDRFLTLGLMEQRIKVRAGVPRLFWSCKVA